jgi:hypothetical protein
MTKFETAGSGFIAMYRWQVERGSENDFRIAWRDITREARTLGALGSCLTRARNGDYVAIALWPSEQARADAFAMMAPRSDLPGVRRVDETMLDVEDDLWAISPFRPVP